VSSGVVRKAVLVFAAAAVVFAVVSVGTVVRFASVTASEVGMPAARDSMNHSAPAIQSTATVETLPAAPPSNELLAAFKVALENKPEIDQPKVVQPRGDQPKAGALINQFQAWAAEEDAQPPARPSQPVEDVRAQVVQNPSANMDACATNTFDGATDPTTSAAHTHTVDVLAQWSLLRSAVTRIMGSTSSPSTSTVFPVASASDYASLLARSA